MNPVIELVNDIYTSNWFEGLEGKPAPLTGSLHLGSPESNVLIAAGANASGKSMTLKIISAWLNQDKIEPIQVSMKYRAGHQVYGLQRAMMFGSEDDESTGVISSVAVQTAFRTARGRTKPHWVLLDEPDIGLAEEFAVPMGRTIGQFATEPGEHTQGVVIVSHSKPLISGLLRELKCKPHFLHMDGTDDMDQWLFAKNERSLEELLSLSDKGVERFRAIQAFLNERKKNQ